MGGATVKKAILAFAGNRNQVLISASTTATHKRMHHLTSILWPPDPQGACLATVVLCVIPPDPHPQRVGPDHAQFSCMAPFSDQNPLQGCGAPITARVSKAQMRLGSNPNPQPQQYRPLCTWKGSKDQCQTVGEPIRRRYWSVSFKRVTESQINPA